jgi:hypothetical protein
MAVSEVAVRYAVNATEANTALRSNTAILMHNL